MSTDHAEQAESATRAAQAALDQMNPDPAELAILAASHWLGAIHQVLREAFAPAGQDAVERDGPIVPVSGQVVEDAQGARPVFDEVQGALARRRLRELCPGPHDAIRDNPDGSFTCLLCGEWSRYGWAAPPTAEQDGEPTVEQARPDLDRHAREAALLRDDR